jgi:hypothetical protein
MRTIAEKEQLRQQELETKKRTEQKLRDTFDKYDGDLSAMERLTPKPELIQAGWNHHSLFAFMTDDAVYMHQEQSDVSPGYVRTVHYDGTFVSVVHKSYFHETSR